MNIDRTLKNYRCFPASRPARFVVRDGLTAFVGINNAAKSSLLKFFHEFRSLFFSLSFPNAFGQALGISSPSQARAPLYANVASVADQREVFCRSNDLDLQIELKLSRELYAGSSVAGIATVVITVAKTTREVSCEAAVKYIPLPDLASVTCDYTYLLMFV